MMTAKDEWNEYMNNMYSLAFEDFHRGDYYRALKETLDRLERDCKSNFDEDDFEYISDWIYALAASGDAQGTFMYERGYQDCIGILKRLDVI